MLKSVTEWLFFLLLMGVVVVNTPAQGGRSLVEERSTFAFLSESGVLSWKAGAKSIQTGVVTSGGICGLADDYPNGRDVLIAGKGSTAGRLEHWKKGAGGDYSLVSFYRFAPWNLRGVCYDDAIDRIYVLDATTKAIWVNTWDGVSALPSSNWVPWVTSATLPILSDADVQTIQLGSTITDSPSSASAITLMRYMEFIAPGLYSRHQLVEVNGTVISKSYTTYGPLADANVRVDSTSATEGGSSVVVEADAGSVVQLIDMSSGQSLGQATVPQNASAVAVKLSALLTIGSYYCPKIVGQDFNGYMAFRCMRRYGSPQSFSDGTRIERIPHPHDNRVGNSEFYLSCPLHSDHPPVAPVTIVGNAAFDIRNPATQADPVSEVNGTHFLRNPLFLPINGRLYPSGKAILTTELPIPNDPALAGQVMLFQFWLLDGVKIRVSEVVGLVIDAAAGQAQATRSSARAPVPVAKGAAQNWRSILRKSGGAIKSQALVGVVRHTK